MKKVFFALMILSVVGAGALWWLMNSLPDPGKTLADKAKKAETSEVASGQESHAEGEKAAEHTGEEKKEEAHAEAASQHNEVPEEGFKKESAHTEGATSEQKPKRRDLFENYGASENVSEKSPSVAKEKTVEKKSPARALTANTKHYVQVKAIEDKGAASRTEAKNLASTWSESLKGAPAAICPVDLLNKGQWIRVLLGPYKSLSEAQKVLKEANQIGQDKAFVTGEMECRP